MPAIQITLRRGTASKKFTGKPGRIVIGRGAGCDLVLPFASLQDRHLMIENDAQGIRVRAAGPDARVSVNGRELGQEWSAVPSPTRVEVPDTGSRPLVLELAWWEPAVSALFLREGAEAGASHRSQNPFEDPEAEVMTATASAGGASLEGFGAPAPGAAGGDGNEPYEEAGERVGLGPLSAPAALWSVTGLFVVLILGSLGFNRYRHAAAREALAADERLVAEKLESANDLLRRKDYAGARDALDAAEPVAHRRPSLAASVAEIDRLRQKPEIRLGAAGYQEIDGQWLPPATAQAIRTARERDDPRINQLLRQGSELLAAKKYDAARAACQDALALMEAYPVKPHPRRSAAEAELAAIKAESLSAEMTAKGLVLYENEWVTPEEKFRREQKAKGLVEFQGAWMTPEQAAEAEKKGGSGLVFFDGKWMTPDQKMQAQGFVQFEGQWVKPEEKAATLAKRKADEDAAKAAEAKAEQSKKVAYAKSQEFIKKQLPSPANAKFPAFGGDKVTVILDDGWYIVKGVVSVPAGGTGSTDRTYYCKLRPKEANPQEWEAETTVFAE